MLAFSPLQVANINDKLISHCLCTVSLRNAEVVKMKEAKMFANSAKAELLLRFLIIIIYTQALGVTTFLFDRTTQ